MVEKEGNPTAAVENAESDEEQEGQAWERMWRAIDQIRERNADKDPEDELAFITQMVDEVRQERYVRQLHGTPKPRLTAVIDTNLFVSGTIFKRGNPFALLEAWRSQRFDLLRSDEQYVELVDVFGRPKITVRYGVTDEELVSLFIGMAAAQRAPLSLQSVALLAL